MIGQTIAHYKVTAKLGAGGMGEVYRATDSKLGREVALKVLPPAFAQDAQRMARFQREAQVLASLNHPNIAAIYGIEHHEQIQALAMELVEGPTLAERIAVGAIPWEDALPLAKQIAEALEYAHEKGIIHRDLKPANIKLTADGHVKVLDFGLAKAMADDTVASTSGMDLSPTLSMAATKAGIILGTAAYMAPEQAKGRSVDRRADIWSFGVVLYEMLTAGRAFSGEDASEILASVIKSDPNWEALPATAPAHLRKLLRRCLEKDARRRLQAIGEARIQIEEVMADAQASTAVMTAVSGSAAPAWRRMLPWVAAGIMTIAFGVTLAVNLRTPAPTATEVARFEMDLGLAFGGGGGSRLIVSPDGQKIVAVAVAGRTGTQNQFFLRSLESFEFLPMPGTEGASQPFFSPDSQWVGFSADDKLKKVPIGGGLSVTLCEVSGSRGTAATWADDGTIYFIGREGKLHRIPDGGGTPEVIAEPDRGKGEGFRWLTSLPGSRGLLLAVGSEERFDVDALTFDTGKRERVVEGGSWPRYLSTGHILYAQHSPGAENGGFTGGLLVIPFDLKLLKKTGSPIPVLEGVRVGSGGAGYYDAAPNGTLVYAPGAVAGAKKRLTWIDEKGQREALAVPENDYLNLSLSPDATRVAVQLAGSVSADDIHVYDLRRGVLQRLTFEGRNTNPVFTADGRRVIYSSSSTTGPSNLWWKAADGSGAAERLTTSESRQRPSSVSMDGKLLAFIETGRSGDSRSDIFVMPLEGERKPQPFLQTPLSESGARFSPDGRWIAYSSNESGVQVYVQPYPSPGGKWQVSSGEGTHVNPVWSRDGKQLYYIRVTPPALIAVDVTTQPVFRLGKSRVLLEGITLNQRNTRNFDLAADGRLLVALRPQREQEERAHLRVVLNFSTEIRRRTAPAKP